MDIACGRPRAVTPTGRYLGNRAQHLGAEREPPCFCQLWKFSCLMCLGAWSTKLVVSNVVIGALSGVLPRRPPQATNCCDRRSPPFTTGKDSDWQFLDSPWLVTRIFADFARLPSDAVRRQKGRASSLDDCRRVLQLRRRRSCRGSAST